MHLRPVHRLSPLLCLAATLAAAGAVAAAAPGLTTPAHAGTGDRGSAAVSGTGSTIRVRGALWIDCRRDGRRSAEDPPVRDAIVELVSVSGQLSTTLTNRAGAYAFTLRRSLSDAVVVPLIQTALDDLVPSPASSPRPRAGRSVGTRVADLDRAAVSPAEERSSASRYDFGFVASGRSGQDLVRAECRSSERPRRPAGRS